MSRHYLEHLFTPKAIAVFGASERQESVGARVYQNLLDGGFAGSVFAINPKHKELYGRPCHASIDAIKERIDLAVIATPAATVPGILNMLGQHNVRAAIVLSAGFAEKEGIGKALERALIETARRHNIRVMGPNCLGMMRPSIGLNATFSNNIAQPGSLALISQSGALCTAILDWASAHNVGFSTMVSIGEAADVGFGDILDYLALDPETRSILMYVEGVRDARRFMSGLRAAARMKPVIVIKAGRHAEGSRAAMSHTGSLVGADDVFDAALERAGVVRAKKVEQLFAAAQLLSTQYRLHGNRLAIITNAGGPGVMATDRAVERGVKVAELEAVTLEKLNQVLPDNWSHNNPIDILGDATPERYQKALEICLSDSNVDGVLVMLTPQAMTEPTAAAEAVLNTCEESSKPVLTCWMGETLVSKGRELFTEHDIPTFMNPESSIEAFGYLAEYHSSQKLLMQVPGARTQSSEPDIEGARMIIEGALAEHRTLLNGLETKAILHAFNIPVVPSLIVHSPNEALAAAEYLGFPVGLKVNSPDITHKSDVDGVRLNIDAQSIRHAYNDLLETVKGKRPDARMHGVSVEKMYRNRHGRELLIGVLDDPVFGPVISFGAGGTAVEVLRDRAVALPPLNHDLAETLIRQTKISKMLGAFRNLPPVQFEQVVNVLLRISEMVCELPQIKELDLNPLIADDTGVMVLDARIIVRYLPPGRSAYDHMAIHPYPVHLIEQWQLADGTDVTIRPIRPEDGEMTQEFVRKLSPEAKFFRFMQSLQELSQEMLVRFTQIDYHRELALVATIQQNGKEVELGVCRYFTNPDGESGEFAVVVADAWQNRGVGTRLMSCLLNAAQEHGFKRLEGEVLANNVKMMQFVQKMGFSCQPKLDDPGVFAVSRPLGLGSGY